MLIKENISKKIIKSNRWKTERKKVTKTKKKSNKNKNSVFQIN